MKRRILSLVLVLSILIGAAVRPQRADAVVASATVVAASAAAILTACGVTYWAASQTDAVDYISGKLEDYLSSIEETDTPADWLGISAAAQPFTVIAGGALQFSSAVANKLLGFVRWLQNEEGIESDGETVGELGHPLNFTMYTRFSSTNATATYNGQNSVHVDVSSFVPTGDAATHWFYFVFSPVSKDYYTFTITNVSSNYDESISSNDFVSSYYWGVMSKPISQTYPLGSMPATVNNYVSVGSHLRVRNTDNISGDYNLVLMFRCDYSFSGSVDISITNYNNEAIEEPSTVKIIPSDFVNVPADVAEDTAFIVNPAVNLSAGDSTDTATEAILDGVTAEEGLTSTLEETPETSWGWLYTLLVNIANAITDGVTQLKQAVLGLADSIYNKFTTVLQDIKTGISTIVNSITSAVSQLLSAIQSLPTTIYSQFTQVLQDIKTGIQGIALDIYNGIINALTYVFVPSQAFIDTYVASLYATFDNHFSILSYPFSILGQFITKASGIGSPEPIFSWGNVYEPFSGKLLIAAGSYNLNNILRAQEIAYMYQIYMIVVKGFMSFWFLTYLYNWFCDVFKMREADYSPPEVEDV